MFADVCCCPQVQVKAADNSINKEAREALVEGFSKALTSHIPCLNPDRYF